MMFNYYTKIGLALIAVAIFIITVVTYPSNHDKHLELIETRIINDNKLTIYGTLDDCINFSLGACNERTLKVFVEDE